MNIKKRSSGWIFNKTNQPFQPFVRETPVLKPKEVLVKNTFATICASDLHTYFGRRKSHTNSILGHEIVGKIEAISADGATDFNGNSLQIGDRVTWAVYACDHQSEMAQNGFPQKAPDLYKYGHETIDDNNYLNGGFASHSHLLNGSSIFKVPDFINDFEAAPLNCTHATIAGALRLAGDLSRKRVLVNGAGMLGLSACAMAKEAGARHVIAVDVTPEKLKNAKNFGANETILATDSDFADGHIEVDIIIETSGIPEAIENAFPLLTIGGTMVLVGSVFPQRPTQLNAEVLVRKIQTIKGLHNNAPEDLAYAIEFMSAAKSKYPFAELVSATYNLQDLGEAFAAGESQKHYRVGVNTTKN